MKPAEAIAIAKQYVEDTFAGEKIFDIGLEEIEFDESGGAWSITVGFSRPWHRRMSRTAYEAALANIEGKAEKPIPRDYRVVRIRDSDSKVLSVKLHDWAA